MSWSCTELLVVGEPRGIAAGHLGPLRPGGRHKQVGELVADQRVVAGRFDGSGGGNAEGGRADTFGDFPAVAVGAGGGGFMQISHIVSNATE